MGPKSAVHTHITLTLPHGSGPFPTILCGDFIAGDKTWKKKDPAIVEAVVKRGYALAEFDRGEVARDSAERNGVYAAYPSYNGGRLSAWAWAYHRVIDYLVKQPYVDAKRIIVSGHSRGGKTVLLAGATDERIAVTAPNNSGCGGAGCYRFLGPTCETLAMIAKNFPFWFQPEFNRFVGHEDRLPIDQHTLKALVAPRALLSTEGLEDLHANPRGTQQTFLAAREVYDFLGARDRIGIVSGRAATRTACPIGRRSSTSATGSSPANAPPAPSMRWPSRICQGPSRGARRERERVRGRVGERLRGSRPSH